jgi:hypothetical protein
MNPLLLTLLSLPALTAISLLANVYCLRRLRQANRERDDAKADAVMTRCEAVGLREQIYKMECERKEIVQAYAELRKAGDGLANSLRRQMILNQWLRIRENVSILVCNQWKGLALALEVLCESCVDGDLIGALNARREIMARRNTLRAIREYDA